MTQIKCVCVCVYVCVYVNHQHLIGKLHISTASQRAVETSYSVVLIVCLKREKKNITQWSLHMLNIVLFFLIGIARFIY